jgi:hypothetical protein
MANERTIFVMIAGSTSFQRVSEHPEAIVQSLTGH